MAYSKENVLFESARTIMVNDNTNTGQAVREIHYYCEDRIQRKESPSVPKYPAILMEAVSNGSDLNLPVSSWFLTLTPVYSMDNNDGLDPQEEITNMSQRIQDLFNKQHEYLNSIYPAKKLRCRFINFITVNDNNDVYGRLYKKDIIFQLQLGNENITC